MHEQIVYQPEISGNQNVTKKLESILESLMKPVVKSFGENENKLNISIPSFLAIVFLNFEMFPTFPDMRDLEENYLKKLNPTQLVDVIEKLKKNKNLFLKHFENTEKITLEDVLHFYNSAVDTSQETYLGEDEINALSIAQKMFLEYMFKDDSVFAQALTEALAQA